MTQSTSGGGVILNSKGQVLVVSQHGNSWSLPKGRLEEGENTREAASREIKEETGVIKLNFIKELGNYQRFQIGKDGGENKDHLKTIHMFLYNTPEHDLQPEDPDNPEACWVNPDQVIDLLTHPKDKEFFKSVLDDIKSLQ